MSILAAKDPDALLDYGFDWSRTLRSGETITASSWEVSPAGLTIQSSSVSGGRTTVWVSGGAVGMTYKLTNTVTISGRPLALQKTLRFSVDER